MEFRVLGPVQLRAGGRVHAVGEPRQQTVLAVLLLEAGRTVGVDTLVNRVWGESPPRQVRRSLQAHIARIRRALEQAEPGSARLTRESGGYRLDIPPTQVDVFRFRAALRDGNALDEALRLWQGEPLAGLRGEWAERMRRTLREEHATAIVAWAGTEISAGKAATTVARLTELTDEHPLHEMAAATLMRALYATGRAADALGIYERVRRALRDELGTDPGPELSAVHSSVLRHDLPAQEPVAVPAQLPAAVAAFTGRDDVLDELDRHAERVGREPVLVCLTGTAGVGKTATAVHWGHRVRERFPDGQLYVDLRGYDPEAPMSPADALAGFLTALLPAGADIPLGDAERAARLRTELAGRRMLLVIDNAHSVEQVRMLLPGTSSCLVVVTSRDSLAGLVALHGAHRVAVDQLPLPDAVALLRRLIGPRVDADPASAEALAERCVRLPLPLRLAAELAASRPAVPLSRLVDELRAALDVLSGGSDERAAVRAVFSWSLRQLPDAATQAFAALGRHPAPTFDAHGLAVLAGIPLEAARALLDTLVRAHLVQPVRADRYGMHDLLKAYAAETGGIDERAAVDRLYGYYLATIATAMDQLYPGEAHRRPRVPTVGSPVPVLPGTGEAREWLDAEISTVADLTAHAATHDRPWDAIVLAQLLFRYLDGHHQTIAIVIHDHACAAARSTGDRATEATAMHMRANVHLYAGRVAEAEADLRVAIDMFEEINDWSAQARSLCNLGMLFERAGHYLVAIQHYAAALALSDEDTDPTGRAHILTRLGTAEARIGRGSAAQTHLSEAMTLHWRASHRFGEAWVWLGLAELATADDRLTDALTLYTDAAKSFRLMGHREGEAWALDGAGRTETLRGTPSAAIGYHRRALELFEAHGSREGESWAHNGLGEAQRANGNLPAARAHHKRALEIATQTGVDEQATRAQRALADPRVDPDGVPERSDRPGTDAPEPRPRSPALPDTV